MERWDISRTGVEVATMQDVATLANVSLSTVSYAINKTRPISAATRERIERAMVELDFRPNAIARSLASKRSRILALNFPGIENGLGATVMEFVPARLRQPAAAATTWWCGRTRRPRQTPCGT
jgi:DNA-binding LacI/PurR family transcriptional regulator